MTDRRADAYNKFRILRAEAINGYGQLEQAQLSLFAALLGVHMRKAATVLAAMQNTRSRHMVIQELLFIEHGEKYKRFYTKLYADLSRLDGERNRIVHWIEVGSTTGGEEFFPERDITLAEHPNFFGLRKLHASDLRSFVNKASFYSSLVFRFASYLQHSGRFFGEDQPAWLELFLRPPEYPPPANHPMNW